MPDPKIPEIIPVRNIITVKFKTFLHFDLYRITTEEELEEIKFLEQFLSKKKEEAVS